MSVMIPKKYKQKTKLIKYTKIPEFEFDTNVSWSPYSYTLPPRLRRIVTLEDTILTPSKSFHNDRSSQTLVTSLEKHAPAHESCCLVPEVHHKREIHPIPDIQPVCDVQPTLKVHHSQEGNQTSVTLITQEEHRHGVASPCIRRIVTISEDDEINPYGINKTRKPSSNKLQIKCNRPKNNTKNVRTATENSVKDSSRIKSSVTTRRTTESGSMKDIKSLKFSSTMKEINVIRDESKVLGTPRKKVNDSINLNENRKTKRSENSKNADIFKIEKSSSQNLSIKPMYSVKTKSISEINRNIAPKTSEVVSRVMKDRKVKSGGAKVEEKNSTGKNLKTAIHVPLEKKVRHQKVGETVTKITFPRQADCCTTTGKDTGTIDAKVGTDPPADTKDNTTEVIQNELQTQDKNDSITQTNFLMENCDSLKIPNFTLSKDKCETSGSLSSKSLPNLQIPSFKITSSVCHTLNENTKSDITKNESYFIGRATVTYTTSQKIDFVVGKDEEISLDLPSKRLAYPFNVVSVFKNELKKKSLSNFTLTNAAVQEDNPNANRTDYVKEMKTLNYAFVLHSNKLMKPSDTISVIRGNSDLLQNDYIICEQFQKELHFIDSFFESLQYLENCSMSDSSLLNNNIVSISHSQFNPEYGSLFSKFEDAKSTDDAETMATKSLCLLNLLIRNEQRRAKNLLFILKMREDALKDFTKSQIIWLENKKKQDNIDITTLKKKQRGALLKLQHECGEMQRIRKALLALSEKRKLGLMKTKKNIELKLKNSVNLDQILGKKKLKRPTGADRNTAPLKCFDLSSSGCEDIAMIRTKPDSSQCFDVSLLRSTKDVDDKCAEKCIQTSDKEGTFTAAQITTAAPKNFVTVDGSYLNILFHDLLLPEIFSKEKQYEVNEEALRNIVNTSNNRQNHLNGEDVDKFIDQIKNRDVDSSPSTARSLVEELDQYYKNLAGEDRSSIESDQSCKNNFSNENDTLVEDKVDGNDKEISPVLSDIADSNTMEITNDSSIIDEPLSSTQSPTEFEALKPDERRPQTGPLPVPAGAAAVIESVSTSDTTNCTSTPKLINDLSNELSKSLKATLNTPVLGEAEELRRQQLAIEREIKALEQQQCQLLVVREIPDKPPPPYTPPTETRTSKQQHKFLIDDECEQKLRSFVYDLPLPCSDGAEPYDVFLKDFVVEKLEKSKQEQKCKPWETNGMLSQEPQFDMEKLLLKSVADLKDTLTCASPSVVPGVTSRRSDHIDDILFAEWRSCETEWTALHKDEVIVKNQISESIFRKLLSETIAEYETILSSSDVDDTENR